MATAQTRLQADILEGPVVVTARGTPLRERSEDASSGQAELVEEAHKRVKERNDWRLCSGYYAYGDDGDQPTTTNPDTLAEDTALYWIEPGVGTYSSDTIKDFVEEAAANPSTVYTDLSSASNMDIAAVGSLGTDHEHKVLSQSYTIIDDDRVIMQGLLYIFDTDATTLVNFYPVIWIMDKRSSWWSSSKGFIWTVGLM